MPSPLWSISRGTDGTPAPLQRWRQQLQNQVPSTGREVGAQVARGAPRSPSAVQNDRDIDLRAHTRPARPHHGRPTVLCAWAPPNWVLGRGPLGQGSRHLLRLWLRACAPVSCTRSGRSSGRSSCALTWVQSSDLVGVQAPRPEPVRGSYIRSGVGPPRAGQWRSGVYPALPRQHAPWLPWRPWDSALQVRSLQLTSD